VTDKAQKTIHLKWVRSGIAFTRHQKDMIRSLGFGRLNQVVERPDTAPIRGLVANLAHLVRVVPKPVPLAWMEVPEYTIHPPEVTAEAPARKPKPASAPKAEEPKEAAAKESKAASDHAAKAKKPAKAPKAKPADSKKAKAADKAKPAKKSKK
jgi:large subunit ribosomal protein L30